jgi:hypothetical protein
MKRKKCKLEKSYHTLSLEQVSDKNSHPTCGFNSSITLDGKTLKGVQKIIFEVPAEGPAIIYLKMIGNIEVRGMQFDKLESSMICLTCKDRLKCEVNPKYKDVCVKEVKFSKKKLDNT